MGFGISEDSVISLLNRGKGQCKGKKIAKINQDRVENRNFFYLTQF